MASRIRLVIRAGRPGDGAAEGDTRRGPRRGLSKPIVLWIIVYLTGGLLATVSIDTPGDSGFGFAWPRVRLSGAASHLDLFDQPASLSALLGHMRRAMKGETQRNGSTMRMPSMARPCWRSSL